MTNIYHEDPYKKETTTTFKASFEEDGGIIAMVTDALFYPHGGGQKGDRGFLIVDGKEFKVINTIKDKYSDNGVCLVVENLIPEEFKGKEATLKLDWAFRYKQMRLHSAVHLHHCMMERIAGKTLKPPKTSDIQDGFAFNRYESNEITPELVEAANKEFEKVVATGADVATYPDPDKGAQGFRWWKTLEFLIPCGGTHVSNINEIGRVEMTFTQKKGKPTINIALLE